MRKLNKPTNNSGDVFIECIEIVRNASLKARLTATKYLIEEAASEFEVKVTTGNLHTVAREIWVNGNVSSKELADVYTYRMAKQGSPGRSIYDKLKIAAPNGICPLCAHRTVTTIDHYLPKTEYPRLSVVPINLVPSCSDCNKVKLTSYPRASSEEPLHPYYDDIEEHLWLEATVNHSTPPTIQFDVAPHPDWDTLLCDRVKFHFDSLEINKLYASQAAVELVQINYRLRMLHQTVGAIGVKNHLIEGAETRSHANVNSWQSATYSALAADEWFCDGGFRLF
jgi:hypothetical protein